jgi:hypothetical protein
VFLASQNGSEVCELIEKLDNDVLFVINELSKILDEFGTGTSGAESSTNLLELLDGVESFFGVLMSEIIKKSGQLVFLFHSSILEN